MPRRIVELSPRDEEGERLVRHDRIAIEPMDIEQAHGGRHARTSLLQVPMITPPGREAPPES